MKLIPVILSGGSGTRLWPKSRQALPKQFLRLTSEHSMLQETLLRLNGIPDLSPPLLVCNHEHRFMVAEQLRALNLRPQSIYLEPCARNTAPAVAVAALAAAREPEDLLLVLPSDHVVRNVAAFHAAVQSAADAAFHGNLVMFGIVPHWAEPGYGYIRRGEPLATAGNAFKVAQFVEKPDGAQAGKLFSSGEYLWNSGMFLFQAGRYLEELRSLRPEILNACERALAGSARDSDFCRLEEPAFGSCPSVSIDYAVMEHTDRAAVVPVEMGWSDVGSWAALWEINDKDGQGNCLHGDLYADKVSNCYVNAEHRMVAALGVKDLVIVETADAVLVAHKEQAQDVKQLVEHLKNRGRSEHINHRRVYRPWGYFESVDDGGRFQVKRILVNPGAKLSLQMHHHRAEHWVVVSGTAKVTRGDEVVLLTENQSTYIPLGTPHRLENPGKLPLQVIEVQSGSYLGEDDIVRFEDSYHRV